MTLIRPHDPFGGHLPADALDSILLAEDGAHALQVDAPVPVILGDTAQRVAAALESMGVTTAAPVVIPASPAVPAVTEPARPPRKRAPRARRSRS